MVYIISMWCDGACKNNGGYDTRKPVFGGAGVYYPRGKKSLGMRCQKKALTKGLNQGNPAATSNRKYSPS